MSINLPTTPDHQGDLEARQALLSEDGEATSRSVTPDPTANVARTRATGESWTESDSIAGTVVLVSPGTVQVTVISTSKRAQTCGRYDRLQLL